MGRGRPFARSLVAAAALLLAAGTAWADPDTTGTVSIERAAGTAELGFAWGNGVLEYRGERYPFTVRGFSVIDAGVSKVFAQGKVYNLENVEDFEGRFMAAMAGATPGGGAGAAAMQNQNDVRVVWTATSQGLSVSLAQAGFSVRFTEQARQVMANQKNREGQPAAAPRVLQE